MVTIPVHARKTIGVGLLTTILRQADVSMEDLRDAL
jgi:predicted RNA binding protein YcfA (HicA-like mRNA interferase family)